MPNPETTETRIAPSTATTVEVLQPGTQQPYATWIAAQVVAQSTAIAVQDGAQYLRNVSAMATSAIGAAMAQMLASRDPSYADVIAIAQRAVDVAADSFQRIGVNAARITGAFPSREP